MKSTPEIKLTRRSFVAAGGSLALAVYLPKGRSSEAEGFRPSAWIEIDPGGDVSFVCDRTDMGQGSPWALARIVAEELEVPWERVSVAPMPDNPAGWPRTMGTGGSTAVSGSFDLLRKAAASAREMLRLAAAVEWGISPSECVCRDGVVTNRATGARLGYGALTAFAAQLDPPQDPPLKDVSEYRLVGRSFPRPDVPPKTLGTQRYASDVRLPRQMTALIDRSPWPGSVGRRAVYDASAALNLPGVADVFEIPGDEHRPPGVVVLADDFWQAHKARTALEVRWVAAEGGSASGTIDPEADFRRRLVTALYEPAPLARSEGNVQEALQGPGVRRVTAQYEAPFLHHATMEPMNCTADVQVNRCEVWAPTQAQTRAQQVAAKLTGLPIEAVHIYTPALGGGFGRRLENDYVAEAVLASQYAGRPVKVMWTREDDMQHGYFRPAAISLMHGALDQAGELTVWRQRVASPSVLRQLRGMDIEVDTAALHGVADLPYRVSNLEVSHGEARSPVNVGFWRSVGHSFNCFFVETFVDELANAAGRDPYAFRLSLLPEQSRMSAVLALAAKEGGWGRPLGPQSGLGIACSASFGSYVAQVARVSVVRGELRIERIDCAVDCGLAVDPATLEAQVSGGILYGLTAALHGRIHFDGNGVKERNFDSYRMLLMNDTPDIRVHIVNSGAPIGGIGEVGVPPAAPAVGNAIFAALGKRLRALPFEVPAAQNAPVEEQL
ncbi:MAG: molybdopterin-dependent oxidoreductase [Gammaproteobacteria bacterium]|nr:molybdopterin-dependent oxidoreductase [Gammaproteobacteria bacterium]